MISGNCTGDSNPDAWFPESPQGAQTPAKMKLIAMEISRAIGLCNTCPMQKECYAEGMEPKNLAYGVWGGKLAGERIAIADALGMSYMVEGRTGGTRTAAGTVISDNDRVTIEARRNAVNFFMRIKPYLEVA